MNTNRHDGNTFETDLCWFFHQHGYWAHNIAQVRSGQPADILIAKNGTAYLIDAKNCKGDSFSLSRIEENQEQAMQLWTQCGNGQAWFAIRMSGEIWMVPFSAFLRCTQKSVSARWMKKNAVRLDEWIEREEIT